MIRYVVVGVVSIIGVMGVQKAHKELTMPAPTHYETVEERRAERQAQLVFINYRNIVIVTNQDDFQQAVEKAFDAHPAEIARKAALEIQERFLTAKEEKEFKELWDWMSRVLGLTSFGNHRRELIHVDDINRMILYLPGKNKLFVKHPDDFTVIIERPSIDERS